MHRRGIRFLIILLLMQLVSRAAINSNQIGFYPDAEKIAVVTGAAGDQFEVIAEGSGEVVFTGTLGEAREWDASGESTRIADFSEVKIPGSYFIRTEGCPDSYPFLVDGMVHNAVARASIKAFYYNRCSYALAEEFAGIYTRKAGHPDTAVLIHNSAESASRPAGTTISSPGGWYDAGDFGKYVVNSGISTYTLLAAYESFPNYYDTLKLTIPESGNSIPDLVDEALYNLRWMLTMQDPGDGGVYHKLTASNFAGMVMPENDSASRYVVSKSTTATLDFAAVCAQAARIFRKFDDELPGFADSCLDASLHAWRWARDNPSEFYSNATTNSPAVTTGGYGDRSASDELLWAATELYIATKQDSFHTVAFPGGNLDGVDKLPSWPTVGTLALYSLFLCGEELPAVSRAKVVSTLDEFTGSIIDGLDEHPYRITMKSSEFNWGSNAVAANKGMALVLGFLASGKEHYRAGALHQLDYLLGRNPTGYSFVTGYGDRTPMLIHHRVSSADGIEPPIPGFLAGGPNPGQQDRDDCDYYTSDLPALSYTDMICSYASNEIAINWNAPMAFLAGAAEALFGKEGFSSTRYPAKNKEYLFRPVVRPCHGDVIVQLPPGTDAVVTIENLQGRLLYRTLGDRTLRIPAVWPLQVVFVRIRTNDAPGKQVTAQALVVGR